MRTLLTVLAVARFKAAAALLRTYTWTLQIVGVHRPIAMYGFLNRTVNHAYFSPYLPDRFIDATELAEWNAEPDDAQQ